MSIHETAAGTIIRLVQFTRADGAGGTLTNNYCSASSALTVGGTEFAPLPLLEYDLDANEGGAKTWLGRITVGMVQPFVDRMAGIPQPMIKVSLAEMVLGDEASLVPVFEGTVKSFRANPEGKADLLKLELEGIFARGNASLGIECTQKCAWDVFSPGCRGSGDAENPDMDIEALSEPSTITAIDGYEVTVSGLATTGSAGYFERGSLMIGGAPVLIRGYTTGSTMRLSWRLPASLVGAEVVAVPGCDGRPETCGTRWPSSNIGNFLGLGIKMPDREPDYQQ